MDTGIDGKVQRIQEILYASMQIGRPSRLEPDTGKARPSGSAVGGWGNTFVGRPEGVPCPYHNMRHIVIGAERGLSMPR
jgi:hypothetical protein